MLPLVQSYTIDPQAMAMIRKSFIQFATISALVLAGSYQIGVSEVTFPGAIARTTVSDNLRDFELRGAALSANGTITELIIAARAKGRQSESESLVRTTVDATGRILMERNPIIGLPIADASKISLSNPTIGSAFVSVRNRSYLLLPTKNGGIQLVRLTNEQPSVIRSLDIGGRSPFIRRVLVKDEHLVLLGSLGTQALVTEVDTEGKTVFTYSLPEEGLIAINAVFETGGTMAIIAEKGTLLDATTWVGRISPRGDLLVQKTFAGRPIDIARGSDGTYLLLIERRNTDGSETHMKGLASDFSERWSRSLMSHQRFFTPFRVAPIASGGFIIVGTKDRGLWISRVKLDGTQEWAQTQDPMKSPELEMVSNLDLVSMKDIFITAYTAFIVVGREQHEVVRVIRFRAN
jgi:hypothetical protein